MLENLVLSVSHNCTGDKGDGDSDKCHGIELFRKSVYGSTSATTVREELELFFGTPSKVSRSPALVASYDSTTLAIIKPHAIQAGGLNILQLVPN